MKRIFLTTALALTAYMAATAQTKAIAHRGFWDTDGSAQNSIASLQKADQAGMYGAEFDVHITKDGIAVIHHDDTIQGLNIQQSNFADIRNLKLSNGETIPTLETYLQKGSKNKKAKLILEIKPHRSKEADERAVKVVLDLVKKHKLSKQTEYISFSLDICKELIRLAPGEEVAYLRGELSPKELKEMGFTGMDYHYKIMEQHPEWIKEAHDLGLSVNVWTVNDEAIMTKLIDQKVDYITTDKPLVLKNLLH